MYLREHSNLRTNYMCSAQFFLFCGHFSVGFGVFTNDTSCCLFFMQQENFDAILVSAGAFQSRFINM